MTVLRFSALALGLLALAACGPPAASQRGAPKVAGTDWPELVPLAPILRDTATLKAAEDPTEAELSRADALRKRAEAIRALDAESGL